MHQYLCLARYVFQGWKNIFVCGFLPMTKIGSVGFTEWLYAIKKEKSQSNISPCKFRIDLVLFEKKEESIGLPKHIQIYLSNLLILYIAMFLLITSKRAR